MTAYAPAATAPATPRTTLALVTLLVLAVHALLLIGLPHWARTVPVTGGPPVFETRTIALTPPAANPAPATPEPPSRPKPPVQRKPAPPTPDTPDAPDESATDNPSDVHPFTPAVPTATDTGASLLQAAPTVTFGGKSPLPPIAPPLPPDQALAVMRQAAQPIPAALPTASSAATLAASSAAPDARTPGTANPPPPVQWPRPAEITYQTTVTQGGRLVAVPSTLNWRHDGQFYDLRWILYGPAIGDHSRYATGLVTARGLAPVTARGAGPEDAYDITFDYAQSRLRSAPPGVTAPVATSHAGSARPGAASALPVISVAGGGADPSTDQPLPPGVQDPASVLIELGALIAGNPAQYPVGSRIALPVAHGAGQPAVVDFVIVDDNDLAAAGQFEGQRLPALHLVHEPANAQDTRIELWLGKRLDYLPARLLIVRPSGDQFDLMLQGAYLQTVQPSATLPASAGQAADSRPPSP